MRKVILIAIACMICTVIMVGCNGNGSVNREKEENRPEALEIENKNQESDKQIDNEIPNSNNEEQEDSENTEKIITIYFPNENADGFEVEEKETSSLSEGWIMEQLINKDVVPSDVEVLSCTQTTDQDMPCLVLDLNQSFASYLQSMGTSGEYVVLGSVCNTYLDAYDCSQIQITVEGNVLETGHSDYPGYMTKFE